MSSISTIRRYEAEDQIRVQAAAESFCNRHGINFDEFCDAETSIDYVLSQGNAQLRKLWTACYCRALRVQTCVRITTGYGYVGYRCS